MLARPGWNARAASIIAAASTSRALSLRRRRSTLPHRLPRGGEYINRPPLASSSAGAAARAPALRAACRASALCDRALLERHAVQQAHRRRRDRRRPRARCSTAPCPTTPRQRTRTATTAAAGGLRHSRQGWRSGARLSFERRNAAATGGSPPQTLPPALALAASGMRSGPTPPRQPATAAASTAPPPLCRCEDGAGRRQHQRADAWRTGQRWQARLDEGEPCATDGTYLGCSASAAAARARWRWCASSIAPGAAHARHSGAMAQPVN